MLTFVLPNLAGTVKEELPLEEIISQYLLEGVLTVVTLILTGAYTRLSKKFTQQKEESEATKLGVRRSEEHTSELQSR